MKIDTDDIEFQLISIIAKREKIVNDVIPISMVIMLIAPFIYFMVTGHGWLASFGYTVGVFFVSIFVLMYIEGIFVGRTLKDFDWAFPYKSEERTAAIQILQRMRKDHQLVKALLEKLPENRYFQSPETTPEKEISRTMDALDTDGPKNDSSKQVEKTKEADSKIKPFPQKKKTSPKKSPENGKTIPLEIEKKFDFDQSRAKTDDKIIRLNPGAKRSSSKKTKDDTTHE